ncbi:hypothetical protein TNCV_4364401 [Trichonephila clavipes]|nr:hypothetical protein TNCV_4364401 [Trichonephila clavipes]
MFETYNASHRVFNVPIATRGLLATDHVILNHGHVGHLSWHPSPNYHTTPTGGRFSSTDLTCIAALHGGSLVVLGSNCDQASHDPIPIPLPDGHGYELVSSVRALVPQKFIVEEELMHVKHVEVKSLHVGVMWKFGRGVISSGPKEELLGLLPLKVQTHGEDIANAVIEYMDTHHIPLDKIVSISTEGAKRKFNSLPISNQLQKEDRDSLLCRLDKVFKSNGIVSLSFQCHKDRHEIGSTKSEYRVVMTYGLAML